MEKEKDLFPLSYSQRNIWNLEQAYTGLPVNNICTSLHMEGNFQVEPLKRCIRSAYEAFPVLRTRIVEENGQVMQYISDEIPENVSVIDFSKTNQSGVTVWNQSVAREHLPLFESRLCEMTIFKLSENAGGILTRVHHMIADAWSQTLVTNHIITNYFQLLQFKDIQTETTPDYQEHVEAERKYMGGRAFERDREFWRENLRELPVTQLKEHRYTQVAPVGVRHSIKLGNRMNRMIAAFCMQKGISPFAVFYIGLSIYMARLKRQNRFCIGVPTINRVNFREKQSGGMFVNTMPFVNEVDMRMSLGELNEKLKNDWFSLLYHQRLPFSEIKKLLTAENSQVPEHPFDLVLSYQNGKMDHLRGARVTVEGRWIYSGYQAEALCIHVSSRDAENQFLVDYDYLTQIFSEKEIERFHEHLMQILSHAILNPDTPICELSLLGEEEEERLIFEYNQKELWYKKEMSLAEQLHEIVETHQERAAVIWEGERITYKNLWEQAGAFALGVRERVPDSENVIAVCIRRQKSFLSILVGILCSGNTWVILDEALPEGRLLMMADGCNAALCICDKEKEPLFLEHGYQTVTVEALEQERREFPEEYKPAKISYLVYTSGSTGTPKAVAVGPGSIRNLAANLEEVYPKGAVLSVGNVGFDAFLLESIVALLNGRTVVFAKEEDCNAAEQIGNYIEQFDVGFLALTPSRLQSFLKYSVFQKAMSHLECIICGGENFPPELLREIRRYCHGRIYNQYGPSEATVAVSHALVTGDERINIGTPFANCRIYILDENFSPMPVGCSGEIYIGGDCLALGYYQAEELTGKKFIEDPYIPGERLYRTGDVGEWTTDGELLFHGRKDRQMKLLGHRIEPGEVEACLTAYPGVTKVAVMVWHQNLTAYYTASGKISPEELLAYSADFLPRYMIPVYAEQLSEIPCTASGKVDYGSLPEPELPDREAPPENDVQRTLLTVWKQVLGKEDLGIHSDYFLSGGDSLNAMAMLLETEKHFQKKISLSGFYKYSTIQKFSRLLEGEKQVERKIEKAPAGNRYPLTPAQQSFYILEMGDETKKSYHMAGAFRVEGELLPVRLEHAFQKLIEAEEMLRTRFVMEMDQLQAVIEDSCGFGLEQYEGNALEDVMETFVRPFSLDQAPLLRAAICRICEGGTDEQYLLLDMHHILSDGISSALLMQRLQTCYNDERIRTSEITYRDYAYDFEKRAGDLSHREYWENLAKEGMPELMMPTDRPRPPVFDGKGSRWYMDLSDRQRTEIEEYCKEQRITAATFFFSAYAILLSRVSGQEEVVIGMPFSGRTSAEIQDILGAFVNTVPVPVHANGDLQVRTFTEKVQTQIAEMIDHQSITLSEVMEMLGVKAGREKNPVYSVLFSFTPLNPDSFELGEARLLYVPGDSHAVKVDLHLEVTPTEEAYRICLEYAESLFDEVTIAYYGRCMQQVIKEMVTEDKRLSEVECVAMADRMRLLEAPMYVRTPYEATTIDQMIKRQAVWQPDKTILTWGEGQALSYEALMEQGQTLAERLKEQGSRAGDVIAFMIKRNEKMIVAMLAVLLCKAAYLPIDPALPKERRAYMLDKAEAGFFLTDSKAGSDDLEIEKLESLEAGNEENARLLRDVDATVNVIFTSGSTGHPKGVMMNHKALANLMSHISPILGSAQDCILCASNCMFDVFTTETILALAAGRHVSIADEEEMMLPWKMAERIKRDQVTILQLTPSRMILCMNDEHFLEALAQIRILILMGEPWTMQLKERVKTYTSARIFNIYGPTETSVYNCQADITEDTAIHIGKPIGNVRYYLLDAERKPVMPTALGEIYIAGECLSKGYVNQKEMTEQVFVEDLFFVGERMYKTGDIGRLRADGNWQCVGRVDTQLKLNGHRIEPEEIAEQIRATRLVREAAVVPVLENGVPQYLRACIVEEASYTEEGLRKQIALTLSDYMIPSEIISLKELPRISSGKTDLKALQNMKPEAENQETAAGENDCAREENSMEDSMEELLTQAWTEVLHTRPKEEVSFFEQGGTSLKAILVLNHYYQAYLDLSLNDFYRYPTLREQLEILKGKTEQPARRERDSVERLRKEVPAQSAKIEIEGKSILLTGATGYLGAHLLRELMNGGAGKVYCLTRGASDLRLRETLNYYFDGEFYVKNWNRIVNIQGDITESMLGISGDEYKRLAGLTDIVLHSAADVRHFAEEKELYKVNVEGTKNVLDFARQADAGFVHISTASVAGEYLTEEPEREVEFLENAFDIGQNWRENVYTKTKLLAENLVWNQASVLPSVKVFRVGRLFARQSDGVFQKNPQSNAFYRLVKGIADSGKMPRAAENTRSELLPVDQCAKAVAVLLKSEQSCFHLEHPKRYTLAEILESVKPLERVDDEVFDTFIRAKALEESSGEYVRAVAQTWVAQTKNRKKITVGSSKTEEELESLGFVLEKPDLEQMRKCF